MTNNEEGSIMQFRREYLRGGRSEYVGSMGVTSAVRGLDLAYSAVSESNPSPDYTAIGPLFLSTEKGVVICGLYHEGVYGGKFQRRMLERNTLIDVQSYKDGHSPLTTRVQYVLGAESGGRSCDTTCILEGMTNKGFNITQLSANTNTSDYREKQFGSFCKAVLAGKYYIAENTFTPKELEDLYTDLESYTGRPSTREYKDDMVTAICTAHTYLESCKEDN